MRLDKPVTFNGVFYVSEASSDQQEELSIAIRPKVEPENRISWEDNGGHSRIVDFRRWSDLNINWKDYQSHPTKIPKKFTVVDLDHKKTYTLAMLTLEIYNQKFKDSVCKSPTFENDKDLQEFFLNSSFH